MARIKTDYILRQLGAPYFLNAKNKPNGMLLKKHSVTSEELFLELHNITSPICSCGNSLHFKGFSDGYSKTCKNKECRYNNSISKMKQTILKKTGFDNAMKNPVTIIEMKESCLLKYGVNSPNKVQSIKDKKKESCLLKYGTPFSNNSDIVNYDDINLDYWIVNFIKSNKFDIDECCNYHNISRDYVNKQKKILNITANNINYYENATEKEIKGYILGGYSSRDIIPPLELDIYSEEHKFAVEYNGLMWHSQGISEYSMFHTPDLDKNKHLLKTTLCEEKGIQLFHIFENEWTDPIKRDIWISILKGKQGMHTKIGARKTVIKKVVSKDAKTFLEENHLQGAVNGPIRIGLFYEDDFGMDELVSLMTFGKARMSKSYEYELLRFCTKKNTVVQGGGSKLLKYFEKEYKPKSLVSYANRRWSIGNFYEKAGFTFSHDSVPNYFYFKNGSMLLESRNKYQKHKLSKLNVFDESKTEKENMFINKYRRIFDSGNKIYIKEYTNGKN